MLAADSLLLQTLNKLLLARNPFVEAFEDNEVAGSSEIISEDIQGDNEDKVGGAE
jgi:hypothetical protein